MRPASLDSLFRILLVVSSLLLTAGEYAFAEARVSMRLEPREGMVEDTFSLEVMIHGEGITSLGTPVFKEQREFTVEGGGVSKEISTSFGFTGKSSSSLEVTYSFQIIPKPSLTPGTYEIPQGSIDINGKKYPLKRPKIKITKGGTRAAQRTSDILLSQSVDHDEPYVGEQVHYEVTAGSRYRIYSLVLSDLEHSDLWFEALGKGKESYQVIGNAEYRTYTEHGALFPTKAGELTIPARSATMEVGIKKKRKKRRRMPFALDPFSDSWPSLSDFGIGSSSQRVQKRRIAPQITLNVKPLPAPPLPGLEYIPVGKVKLASSIDKKQVKKGTGITMTVELYGDANLRPYELISEKEASSHQDFKIYLDKPQIETFVEGQRLTMKKKFTMALVPTRAGTLELPEFKIVTFSPEEQAYRILSTPEREIEVLPDTTEDQLIATSAIEREEREKKLQVSPLGEDLLPQHVGAHTFRPGRELSNLAFLLVIILAPLAIFVFKQYVFSWVVATSDPLRVRQKNAYRKVLQTLSSYDDLSHFDQNDRNILDSAAAGFRVYVAEKFQAAAGTLTPKEAGVLIERQLKNTALAKSVETMLSQLEQFRFGREERANDMQHVEESIGKMKELIDQIEGKAR